MLTIPGFIPESIRLDGSSAIYDVVFGAELGQAVATSWKNYLPPFENQKSLPYCVSYSRLNCAEAVAKKKGFDVDFSDRALAVESGTSKEGNSFTTVSDHFRNAGAVLEADCPYVDSWEESVKLPPLSGKRRYPGGSHSWVVGGLDAMRSALQFSPLQIGFGVNIRYNHGDVVPKTGTSEEIRFYHAVVLYYISEKGYEIYDSIYAEFKTLALDYEIPWCKSFRDLPVNWQEIQSKIPMLILQRDPKNQSEIYAVSQGIVKRHIANRQTLLLGAQEPGALWSYAPGDIIPTADESFSSLVEGAEIFLAPKD